MPSLVRSNVYKGRLYHLSRPGMHIYPCVEDISWFSAASIALPHFLLGFGSQPPLRVSYTLDQMTDGIEYFKAL